MLCVLLSEISGYVKVFNKAQVASLLIENKMILLKKYNKHGAQSKKLQEKTQWLTSA